MKLVIKSKAWSKNGPYLKIQSTSFSREKKKGTIMAMIMASVFNREAKRSCNTVLTTLLRNRSCNTVRASSSMAATSSSALFLNPLTPSSFRHFRCSPEISSLSFSARAASSDFSLAMKRQIRSFGDVSERDPSVVCEAVKRETGADGLNIAENVSQV